MATITKTPEPEGAAGKNPILEAKNVMVAAKKVMDDWKVTFTKRVDAAKKANKYIGAVTKLKNPDASPSRATYTVKTLIAPTTTWVEFWDVSPDYVNSNGQSAFNGIRNLVSTSSITGGTNLVVSYSPPSNTVFREFAQNSTGFASKVSSANDPASISAAWSRWKLAVTDYNKKKAAYEKLLNGSYMDTAPKPKKDKEKDGGGSGDGKKTKTPVKVDLNSPVKYNIPSVKTSYFRTDAKYVGEMANDPDFGVLYTPGGSPASVEMVRNANELWKKATNHKGMIQTYAYWRTSGTSGSTSADKVDPNLPEYFGTSRALALEKYGFQFLYNPPSVSMAWSGAPNIDLGNILSGNDTTPFIVPSASSSSLTFQILLNRTADVSILANYGVSKVVANYGELYGAQPQDVDITTELTAIKNLGTMYDVEYLLKTLVGFEMYSRLRNRKTADIGFLMGYPVELHLGKDLRYLGTITGFDVTHEYFSREMVPLRGFINITFERRIEPEANTQGPTTRTNTDVNNTAQ